MSNPLKKLTNLLTKILPQRNSAPGQLTDLDKQLGKKIQERLARQGKPIDTRQLDPNMPRYQQCECGRWAKITDKAQVGGKVGAFYKCSVHGEFFVER